MIRPVARIIDVNKWGRGKSALSALIIGLLAGAIGTGYFVYGKRQQKFAPMLAGLMLGIYPFFTNNPWWLLAMGAALMAAPFYLDF